MFDNQYFKSFFYFYFHADFSMVYIAELNCISMQFNILNQIKVFFSQMKQLEF